MSETAQQLTENESMLGRGYVHVYTGDGKGKTTAAMGLALRALGSGLKVAIIQFMKNGGSGEFRALGQFNGHIRVDHFGSDCFIHGEPGKKEVVRAQRGYCAIQKMMDGRRFDLIILDEANMAIWCGLLTVDALLDLIRSKPTKLELIITGRHAHPRIIEAADLVTEMVEVKHYYRKGVQARHGIEM